MPAQHERFLQRVEIVRVVVDQQNATAAIDPCMAASGGLHSEGVARAGNSSVKTAPPLGPFDALIAPPSDSMMLLAIDSPSPVPFVPLVVKNGSKTCRRCSAEIPGPLSA